jgi:hypothetical protein
MTARETSRTFAHEVVFYQSSRLHSFLSSPRCTSYLVTNGNEPCPLRMSPSQCLSYRKTQLLFSLGSSRTYHESRHTMKFWTNARKLNSRSKWGQFCNRRVKRVTPELLCTQMYRKGSDRYLEKDIWRTDVVRRLVYQLTLCGLIHGT